MIERDSRRRLLLQCVRFTESDQKSYCLVGEGGRRKRRRLPCKLLLAVAACWNYETMMSEATPFVHPRVASVVYHFADLPLVNVHTSPPRSTYPAVRLRGGDNGRGESNDSVLPPESKDVDSSPKLSSAGENSEDESTEAHNRMPFGLSGAFPSLFQLNNNVKYDASLDEDYEGSPLESSLTSSRTTSGRGGAMMVKSKPEPHSTASSSPRRIFQWLAPLETDRVAPLADRLIVDDGEGTVSNNSADAVDNDGAGGTGANDRQAPPAVTASSASRQEESATASRSSRRSRSESKESEVESHQKSRIRNELLATMERETKSRASDSQVAIEAASVDPPEEDIATSKVVEQPPYNELLLAQDSVTSSENRTVIIPESPYVSSGYVSDIIVLIPSCSLHYLVLTSNVFT
jgi:hypothetical protein